MRKSSLAHKVVDTKFSFLTYLVRIIKLMGAADLVAQSFVQNYSTFIIFHFYFQLPPVPPPPEELRQSRQHLAKVEPNVAAPRFLNRPCVTIITNADLSIISIKINVCFVFLFDSVLAFL